MASITRACVPSVVALAVLLQSAPMVRQPVMSPACGPTVLVAAAAAPDVLAIPAERGTAGAAVRARAHLPESAATAERVTADPRRSAPLVTRARPARRARSHPARQALARSDDPAPH